MVPLLMAMLLAPAQSIPESKLMVQDPKSAVAVTDKYLLPTRPPDCKTDADIQHAVAQVRAGEPGDCWVRDVTAFSRR
jgi:hypothetical protein